MKIYLNLWHVLILTFLMVGQIPLSHAHLKWSFEVPGYYSTGSAVDKTGTIYVSNTRNDLYAIDSNGKLLWSLKNVGSHPSIGLDGTIYVASTSAVKAITKDGKIKWSFDQNPSALMIFGPEVGPDGFIYVVATEGLGPFALSPNGELRWHGTEKYNRQNTFSARISFGMNENNLQLYYYANNSFKAINARTGEQIPGFSGGLDPLVAPNGNVHIGTRAYDAEGKFLWKANIPASFATLLDIDKFGNSYYNEYSTKLHMAQESGNYIRSLSLPEGQYLTSAKSSPDASIIMITVTDQKGTKIEAIETATLKKIWEHDFGSYCSWPVVSHLETFDKGSSRVYVTTTNASYDEKFFLHFFSLK